MMSFFTTSSEGREEGEGEQREEIWAKATVPLLSPPPSLRHGRKCDPPCIKKEKGKENANHRVQRCRMIGRQVLEHYKELTT